MANRDGVVSKNYEYDAFGNERETPGDNRVLSLSDNSWMNITENSFPKKISYTPTWIDPMLTVRAGDVLNSEATVTLTITVNEDSLGQIFWCSTGSYFTEEKSKRFSIQAGTHEYTITLGKISLNYLRIDIGVEGSPVTLSNIKMKTAPNDPNPFRYSGEYFDSSSGTYYLRARYYDPATGRFLSEDPAGDGLNWYTYCGNSPILFVDPSGLRIENGVEITNAGYGNGTTVGIWIQPVSYILYDSTDVDSKINAYRFKHALGNNIEMCPATSTGSFMKYWLNMDKKDGKKVPIDVVVVVAHGEKREKNQTSIIGINGEDLDLSQLEGMTIGTLYLNVCYAGSETYSNNAAKEIFNNNDIQRLVAPTERVETDPRHFLGNTSIKTLDNGNMAMYSTINGTAYSGNIGNNFFDVKKVLSSAKSAQRDWADWMNRRNPAHPSSLVRGPNFSRLNP